MQTTEQRTITIILNEDDFDVKCNTPMTADEIYGICVSIMQHLENSVDQYSGFHAPSMLQ